MTQLLALLRELAGFIPGAHLTQLLALFSGGKAALTAMLEAQVPTVVARMEQDGLTPAHATTPALEGALIRSILYLSIKAVVATKLPVGASVVADVIRDHYKASVAPLVRPQLTPATSLAAAVRLVNDALVEIIY